MKKLILTLLASSLMFSIAHAENFMIGVKAGYADLEGSVTMDNDYSTQSKSINGAGGAIFAEAKLGDLPISIGLEYVPFKAKIGIDGNSADSTGIVDDVYTAYVAAHKSTDFGSLYAKAGYTTGEVDVTSDYVTTTITSHDDELQGVVVGLGAQIDLENPIIDLVRIEVTGTQFEKMNITTTSNGGVDTDKRSGDAQLITATIGLAKKF